jgi:hypothetical protein
MSTITLVQDIPYEAEHILAVTALYPDHPILLTNVNFGNSLFVFTCTNPYNNIQNAHSVVITYDANYNPPQAEIEISTIHPQ